MRKLCQTETTGDSRSPSVSGTIVGSGGSGSSTISVASSSTTMDAEGIHSSIPMSSEQFRMELQSMIQTMNNASVSVPFRPPASVRSSSSSSYLTMTSPANSYRLFSTLEENNSATFSNNRHSVALNNGSNILNSINERLGLQHSRTLPRRHSYTNDNQGQGHSTSNFMQCRLSMARKRDFV